MAYRPRIVNVEGYVLLRSGILVPRVLVERMAMEVVVDSPDTIRTDVLSMQVMVPDRTNSVILKATLIG